MAIYVTSDLHGLKLNDLKALLNKVNFCEKDWLYILGDVVDRQNDGGVEILVWLLEQYNVQLILGNHEAMLLSSEFVFDEITEDSLKNIDSEKLDILNVYMNNGGDITLKNLKELKSVDSDTVTEIFEYLKDCPVYEIVSAGGNDFLLCHSGIDNFEKTKKLSQYSADDFIWAWPKITDEYYDDIITVFGHTPTLSYDKAYKGKILRTKTWIDVDIGGYLGNSPALLRLDDLQEFYL